MDRRIKKTKSCMKNALLLLAERTGLSEVTVADICREADISRSTFYDYYRNPSECFQEMMQENLDEFCGLLQQKNNIETPQDFMKEQFQFMKQHRRLWLVYLTQLPVTNETAEKITRIFLEYCPVTYSFETEAERLFWAKYRIYGTMGIAVPWLKGGCAEPVGDLVSAMFKHYD